MSLPLGKALDLKALIADAQFACVGVFCIASGRKSGPTARCSGRSGPACAPARGSAHLLWTTLCASARGATQALELLEFFRLAHNKGRPWPLRLARACAHLLWTTLCSSPLRFRQVLDFKGKIGAARITGRAARASASLRGIATNTARGGLYRVERKTSLENCARLSSNSNYRR